MLDEGKIAELWPPKFFNSTKIFLYTSYTSQESFSSQHRMNILKGRKYAN